MGFKLALILALALSSSYAENGIYIDLCNEPINCCPDGNSTYWFMRQGSGVSVNNLRSECILEYLPSTVYSSRLVVVNSQLENDCLVKYIEKVLRADTVEFYAIGLQDVSTEGIWEWQNTEASESHTSEFQHWSPGFPAGGTDQNCAYLKASKDDPTNGFWEDTSCTATGFFGICERLPLA